MGWLVGFMGVTTAYGRTRIKMSGSRPNMDGRVREEPQASSQDKDWLYCNTLEKHHELFPWVIRHKGQVWNVWPSSCLCLVYPRMNSDVNERNATQTEISQCWIGCHAMRTRHLMVPAVIRPILHWVGSVVWPTGASGVGRCGGCHPACGRWERRFAFGSPRGNPLNGTERTGGSLRLFEAAHSILNTNIYHVENIGCARGSAHGTKLAPTPPHHLFPKQRPVFSPSPGPTQSRPRILVLEMVFPHLRFAGRHAHPQLPTAGNGAS
ncbi:hypothetical protein VTI74DRAFT_333 [Chaetomium olivicolor]